MHEKNWLAVVLVRHLSSSLLLHSYKGLRLQAWVLCLHVAFLGVPGCQVHSFSPISLDSALIERQR